MLRSIYSLVGFSIWATDGEIGKVKDFYFDDESWKIRYLIVETGGWLFDRKVLISPVALKTPFWDAESFPVNLSKEQVKNSPNIDADKPVSRQQEIDLHNHYSWQPLDDLGLNSTPTGMVEEVPLTIPIDERNSFNIPNKDNFSNPASSESTHNDPHLRSFKEVVGYKIFTAEHKVGRVDDFLVDKNWNIPYMVIETGKWHPGKRILTSTSEVQSIQWKDSLVNIGESLESLRSAKEYDYTQLKYQNFEKSVNANT